ncbi:MAG: hypothetical protein ACR2QO_00550 [Acidimicrobiales bacterium]
MRSIRLITTSPSSKPEVIELDAPSVLLQWATGGLFFGWVTTRRREVGLGYGWLLRSSYGILALLAAVIAWRFDWVPGRDIAALGVAIAAFVTLTISIRNRGAGLEGYDPRLDLIAPVIGFVGLIVAGLVAGDPAWLSLARMLVGAAFLGVVTDAMLLGHWYLVQPGLRRAPLIELVRWTGILWLPEVILFLIPVGMASVWTGTIDDGYAGMLGWFWGACVVTTIGLVAVTLAALKEKQYSAVMAATGLLYLAILTGFGIDLVARASLGT